MPDRSIQATVLALALVLAACGSDGTGPARAHGMNGRWLVTADPIDETALGRGTCSVEPAPVLTVDSSAAGIHVVMPPVESLICSLGPRLSLADTGVFGFLISGALDTIPALGFLVDSSSSGEFIAYTWDASFAGDTAGGFVVSQAKSDFYGNAPFAVIRQ
jgi:hypothetical protein